MGFCPEKLLSGKVVGGVCTGKVVGGVRTGKVVGGVRPGEGCRWSLPWGRSPVELVLGRLLVNFTLGFFLKIVIFKGFDPKESVGKVKMVILGLQEGRIFSKRLKKSFLTRHFVKRLLKNALKRSG